MINKLNLFERQWCDLVFENRNQAYGAYELRKESSSRTFIAFLVTMGSLITIICASYLSSRISSILPEFGKKDEIIEMTLPPIETPIEKPVVIPVHANPPKVDMAKYTQFVVKRDHEVQDDIKTMDDLKDKTIGNTDAKGDEKGKEIIFDDGPGDLTDVIEDPKTELPFISVEKMPLFPGGDAELFRYLGNNIKYPEFEKQNGISGTVFLKFVVGKDGVVRDIEVLGGGKNGPGLIKEAVRVVSQMPKWNPGIQNGKPVPVYFNLPVKFTLRN